MKTVSFVDFVSENSIRLLIAAKLVAVMFVLGYTSDLFWIGDKPLKAQAPAPGEAPPKPAPSAPPATPVSEEETASPRRSFLHDILELPKIDGTDLKKDEIARYLTLMERKRAQVEERIALLQKREAMLANIERSVETKLKKLEDEVRFFANTVQKEKTVADERLTQLVEFYKKMPAKKAAPVFETLDKDLVVALFNRLPQKQTTEILAQMTPTRSVMLSEYYGRIRSANEYNLLKEMNAELVKEFDACKGMPKQEAPASPAPATAAQAN